MIDLKNMFENAVGSSIEDEKEKVKQNIETAQNVIGSVKDNYKNISLSDIGDVQISTAANSFGLDVNKLNSITEIVDGIKASNIDTSNSDVIKKQLLNKLTEKNLTKDMLNNDLLSNIGGSLGINANELEKMISSKNSLNILADIKGMDQFDKLDNIVKEKIMEDNFLPDMDMLNDVMGVSLDLNSTDTDIKNNAIVYAQNNLKPEFEKLLFNNTDPGMTIDIKEEAGVKGTTDYVESIEKIDKVKKKLYVSHFGYDLNNFWDAVGLRYGGDNQIGGSIRSKENMTTLQIIASFDGEKKSRGLKLISGPYTWKNIGRDPLDNDLREFKDELIPKWDAIAKKRQDLFIKKLKRTKSRDKSGDYAGYANKYGYIIKQNVIYNTTTPGVVWYKNVVEGKETELIPYSIWELEIEGGGNFVEYLINEFPKKVWPKGIFKVDEEAIKVLRWEAELGEIGQEIAKQKIQAQLDAPDKTSAAFEKALRLDIKEAFKKLEKKARKYLNGKDPKKPIPIDGYELVPKFEKLPEGSPPDIEPLDLGSNDNLKFMENFEKLDFKVQKVAAVSMGFTDDVGGVSKFKEVIGKIKEYKKLDNLSITYKDALIEHIENLDLQQLKNSNTIPEYKIQHGITDEQYESALDVAYSIKNSKDSTDRFKYVFEGAETVDSIIASNKKMEINDSIKASGKIPSYLNLDMELFQKDSEGNLIEPYIYNGSITLTGKKDENENPLTHIPIQFSKVLGNFICKNMNLTNLKNAPDTVNGNFDCSNNSLKNLVGGPKNVYGTYNASNNQIQSLDGLFTANNVDISNNSLTNLNSYPKSGEQPNIFINGNMNVSNNLINDMSSNITIYGELNISKNYLTDTSFNVSGNQLPKLYSKASIIATNQLSGKLLDEYDIRQKLQLSDGMKVIA